MLETTREIQKTLESFELCTQQANQVRQLADKLEHREVTIAVIGQFKRGKTMMVNRMLGSGVLPVGIVPITAAVTRIRFAEDADGETARVWYLNGLSEDVKATDLHRFISEQENRDNELGVAEVELRTNADFLRDGLVLVDTPGVGSVHENNSKSAYDFARESDGVIFMLSVDSPINQIEIDFLRDTRRFAGKFYFVVNKIDTIDEEDLAEYLDYCNALLCSIMEIQPGSEEAKAIRLLPISAKKGTGVDRLMETVREDLLHSAGDIMRHSVGLKLLEILKNTRAQISSYREVLRMAPNVFHRRFDHMHEELENLAAQADSLPACDPDGTPKQYLRAQLNEEKALLTAKVREDFGIEYFYYVDRSDAADLMSRDEYAAELSETCRQLEETLDAIFMYKEENAYTVARRIEDLNILMHTLDKYRRRIEREMK
ncbi:MAG: dynamin family protein [Firmicutes bacterium]|nr:dynamin family protein [Bacillota bacterium]